MTAKADSARARYAASTDLRARHQFLTRTRHRALERLAREFPARLLELLDEERAKERARR